MESAILQKVQTIIKAHLDDDSFSVEKLSRKVAISKPELYRKLMANSGQSAHQIIQDIRLSEAKNLLKDRGLSIATVAYSTGFSDPSYFSKVFRKVFGMKPTEYRSQFLKKYLRN